MFTRKEAAILQSVISELQHANQIINTYPKADNHTEIDYWYWIGCYAAARRLLVEVFGLSEFDLCWMLV